MMLLKMQQLFRPLMTVDERFKQIVIVEDSVRVDLMAMPVLTTCLCSHLPPYRSLFKYTLEAELWEVHILVIFSLI